MANVTYLLGAGASYNALPVVDEFTDGIGMVTRILGQKIKASPSIHGFPDRHLAANAKKIQINLVKLLRGCMHHISVDTYLKMLYLTKNPEYDLMKFTMVCFFELFDILKEEINNGQAPESTYRKTKKLDNRYDAFLASILDNSYDRLPSNIKVLSYNYDDQFERSYYNYLQHAKTESTIPELMNIYRRGEQLADYESDKFSFFKINGSANFFDENNQLIEPYNFHSQNQKLDACINRYITYLNEPEKYRSAISFAWDSEEQTKLLLDNIKQATKDTHTLIIVGYSLPFFNRKIDYDILRNMKNLYKVYIQDPNAAEIKDRVLPILPQFKSTQNAKKLIEVFNTKQFHLPEELN